MYIWKDSDKLEQGTEVIILNCSSHALSHIKINSRSEFCRQGVPDGYVSYGATEDILEDASS